MPKTFYEPGRYLGKITRQKLGQSSTGNPQIVLSFEVLGKINPSDPEGELLSVAANYERTMYQSITEKTIDFVVENLDRLGWVGSSWGDFDEDSSRCCDLRGNEVAFSCKHEAHYQTGEMHERWSVAGDGVAVKPLESSEVRKLDAMFGKALKGRGKSASRTPAKPTTKLMTVDEVNREAAAAGDDVPF